MTGTIDADGEHGGPVTGNKEIPGGFRWTTYAERLQKAGVSWKVYQQQDNYGCNALEYFKAFKEAGRGTPLYERGMVRHAQGKFEDDARHDRLPAVSWIIPTSIECEHPDYIPAAGAAFVASKLDAIAANPEVWAKTAVIINYDENDGLFDHVGPPVPPPATPGEFVKKVPIGAGFRVPCIIVSPWTAGGWVSSEPLDHTSVLRFLEKWTGVEEPNITKWRRDTFGDMTSAFRFDGPPAAHPPQLPETVKALAKVKRELAILPKPTLPGADQSMPAQAKGERQRTPSGNQRATS
jgi:phospholipase C